MLILLLCCSAVERLLANLCVFDCFGLGIKVGVCLKLHSFIRQSEKCPIRLPLCDLCAVCLFVVWCSFVVCCLSWLFVWIVVVVAVIVFVVLAT